MDKHHFSSEENAEACGITHIVTHVTICVMPQNMFTYLLYINIYKLTLNMLIIGQLYPYIVSFV